MKNNQPCLLALLLSVLIVSSCKKDITLPSNPLPTGTFSGYFFADHLNSKTHKRDTTFEWVTLTLSAANGFTVKGDTTVRAGSKDMQADSYGSYGTDGFQYMQFSDNSLTATAAAKSKYHLNGLYIYAANSNGIGGTNLSLITSSTDTLYLSYLLSRNQEPVE
jgi:hypothetical protein